MSISPEELSAFVDGQLDPARQAEVAAAVGRDPELAARVTALRQLDVQISSHFAPVLSAPLPERLTRPLKRDAPEVVNFAAARKRRAARSIPRWGWIAGPALAASLALAVFLPRGGEAPDPALPPTVVAALDEQLVATQSADAQIRVLLSFRDDAGQYCRVFATAEQSGIACRDGQEWRLESAGAAGSEKRGEYRMAGAGAAGLLATAQQMASGPALTADEERAARLRGWR